VQFLGPGLGMVANKIGTQMPGSQLAGPSRQINDQALMRVRAMRAKYAKPGWSSQLPAPEVSNTSQPVTPTPAVKPQTAMTQAPAVTTKPAPRQMANTASSLANIPSLRPRGAQPIQQPSTSRRIAIRSRMTAPQNPAGLDVDAYSQAWERQP
jgi:hypothetical protein